MQFTMKRSGLLLSALFAALAALMVTMALASSASASPFCGGASVNHAHKCWGNQRAMSGANAYGNVTGVCVGADLTKGTCAPVNQLASVGVPAGQHSPWVVGVSATFTQTWGNTW
jgi:hypothetical protein